MKILLAADDSKYTKKAAAFLVNQEALVGPENELVVLHVQPAVPPRVKTMLGASAVGSYHQDEAAKVLEPMERFLKRHDVQFRTMWVVGSPATEVVRVAKREKAQMIVMGTRGHGVIGRALMGSVAQSVVSDCDIPVLLVK
ncbi:MAG TPA: universal stress protein [Ramlibacter sp.]|nr:universal stress protein [Ramlibacter sp.]